MKLSCSNPGPGFEPKLFRNLRFSHLLVSFTSNLKIFRKMTKNCLERQSSLRTLLQNFFSLKLSSTFQNKNRTLYFEGGGRNRKPVSSKQVRCWSCYHLISQELLFIQGFISLQVAALVRDIDGSFFLLRGGGACC